MSVFVSGLQTRTSVHLHLTCHRQNFLLCWVIVCVTFSAVSVYPDDDDGPLHVGCQHHNPGCGSGLGLPDCRRGWRRGERRYSTVHIQTEREMRNRTKMEMSQAVYFKLSAERNLDLFFSADSPSFFFLYIFVQTNFFYTDSALLLVHLLKKTQPKLEVGDYASGFNLFYTLLIYF